MSNIKQTFVQTIAPNDAALKSNRASLLVRIREIPAGIRNTICCSLFLAAVLVGITFVHPNLHKTEFLTGGILSLFVITTVAIQTYVYLEQWRVMQHQMKLMTLSECPFVSAKVRSSTSFTLSDDIVIQGTFLNYGRTPAFEFQKKARVVFCEPADTNVLGRLDWDSVPLEAESTLLPAGADLSFEMTLQNTNGQSKRFLNRNLAVCLDIQCRYIDMLGESHVYSCGVTYDGQIGGMAIRYEDYRI